jgi:hypothetical protein
MKSTCKNQQPRKRKTKRQEAERTFFNLLRVIAPYEEWKEEDKHLYFNNMLRQGRKQ